jgi:hypothetical protein
LIESVARLTDQVQTLTKQLEQQTKKTKHFEARLMRMIQSSPATPAIERDAANFDIGSPAAGTKRALDVDIEEEDHDSPPTKQSKATSEPRDAFAAMDGLASAATRTNDINVVSQLELLHSTGVFQAKKRQADAAGEVVTKSALFDSSNKYFFGYNQSLAQDSKGGKRHYTNAMTVVAIVIDGDQWNQMFDESLDSAAVRAIVSDVSKKVHEKIKALEIRFLNRKPTEDLKPLKNLRSVSGKWKKINDALSKTMKSEIERDNWLLSQLGEAIGPQRSLGQFWNKK